MEITTYRWASLSSCGRLTPHPAPLSVYVAWNRPYLNDSCLRPLFTHLVSAELRGGARWRAGRSSLLTITGRAWVIRSPNPPEGCYQRAHVSDSG